MRPDVEPEAKAAAKPNPMSMPRPRTRPLAPGSLRHTTTEMRARPLRTAALLVIAASLAFLILWLTSSSPSAR